MASTANAVRLRKSVANLGIPGDDLDWYEKGVAILRALPLSNPNSWRYMAAVHGYPGHASDPFARAGEKLPTASAQKTFWNQCQHQSWFFLPWHRGYLACFEEIVAAAVVKAGGPPGWALPYWNYSAAAPGARELPAAFRDKLLANGKPNSLWVPGRSMSSPTATLPQDHVSLSVLGEAEFAGTSAGGSPGFGGIPTGFSHFGGTNGGLENLPHNFIHDDIGGLMGDPDTAALDPIFWLHHANIDRLWDVWMHRPPGFPNPTSPKWLRGTTFQLHDAAGKVVKFTAGQMRNTLKVRHGYRYDDISDPLPVRDATLAAAATESSMSTTPRTPNLVAATHGAVRLAHTPTSANVSFDQAASASMTATVAGRTPKAYLNLENVRGSGGARSYAVYVEPPRSAAMSTADSSKRLLAGHLSTFGVRKASGPNAPHGGTGITTVLEISGLIEQLRRGRNWDGAHLNVTFVPVGADRNQSADSGSLEIGRVSIYYG